MRLACLLLAALLLSGCAGPAPKASDLPSSAASGVQIGTAGTSASDTSRPADSVDTDQSSTTPSCPPVRVSWVDDAFAAGYGSLGAGAKANFTLAPGFPAGEAAADPRWPPDGLVSSLAWKDGGGHDFLVQAMPAGAVSIYESAPANSSAEQREAKARAFLDAVAFEPAADRGPLAERLATSGGLQHADPGPGGSASYWYFATVQARSGNVSADALVPGVLENSTANASSSGDVEFSKGLPDGLWRLRARVPKATLTLPDGAEVALDSLGRAFAWHGGEALPEAPALKDQVVAALQARGLPGGSFGSWQMSWAC
jgi:hypothetical protein